MELPADVTGRGVERVEVAVVGTDEDVATPNRSRAVDEVAGSVRPAQLAGGGAEGVHLPVGRADVDAAVGDGGIRVERAGAADSRLRRSAPDLLAGLQVERIDVRVIGAEEDPVPRQRDRALDQPARLEVPAQVPRRGRERVDVVRPVADDHQLVGEERRALARADRPLPANPARLRVEGDHLPVDPVRGVARWLVQERDEDQVVAHRR